MTDRKIDLKNPWVAGLLAWLIPGAGHFYQRRHFKAGIYAVCIIGTLLYGMALGEWRPVHWTEKKNNQRVKNWSFLLQSGVGTPGIVAYMQSGRFYSASNRPTMINAYELRSHVNFGAANRDQVASFPLTDSIETDFEGRMFDADDKPVGTLSGRLHLEPRNQSFKGTFEGTLTTEDGQTEARKLELGNALLLHNKILGSPRRLTVVRIVDNELNVLGAIVGTIPRSFGNWFSAPLDTAALTEIHLRLNKQYEMALVFTWIAGLLNILAVWDAVQGPAYGFGDEPPPEKKPKKKKGQSEDARPPGGSEPSTNGSESGSESSKDDSTVAAGAPVGQEK